MHETTVEAYNNIWKDIQQVSAADFESCITRLGIELPKELEELLQLCNGSYPEANTYSGVYEVSVGNLISVGVKPGNKMRTLEEVYKHLKKNKKEVLINLILFAWDTGNANLFCYNFQDGTVVYLLNNEPDNPQKK